MKPYWKVKASKCNFVIICFNKMQKCTWSHITFYSMHKIWLTTHDDPLHSLREHLAQCNVWNVENRIHQPWMTKWSAWDYRYKINQLSILPVKNCASVKWYTQGEDTTLAKIYCLPHLTKNWMFSETRCRLLDHFPLCKTKLPQFVVMLCPFRSWKHFMHFFH